MQMRANGGYSDDGDRTIEMCLKAEQEGYSPIGVTDGGGQISWSRKMIKQLKRTILVGQNKHWLEAVQKINPKIQIIHIIQNEYRKEVYIMYRLIKDKGNNSNVIIENLDTHAQLNLGRLSMNILSTLEREEDLTFGEKGRLQYKDKWEVNIKSTTAKELSAKAMRMSKPIRDQSKKATEEKRKEVNKQIDAIDVLLGLASYK